MNYVKNILKLSAIIILRVLIVSVAKLQPFF